MTNVQIIDMMHLEAADALDWVKLNRPQTSKAELNGFEAGFCEGWRQAVRYLKLHNALKVAS